MRHPGSRLSPSREFWFAKLEDLYSRTGDARMLCSDACPNLACESGDAEEVLFLPWELEFILEKLGLPSNPFETITLDDKAYGRMTGSRDCPYFQAPDCRIHGLRPFDCRTFPVLPEFLDDGTLGFRQASYCPLSGKLDPRLVELFTSCWRELAPHLPRAWKSHYNTFSRNRSLA